MSCTAEGFLRLTRIFNREADRWVSIYSLQSDHRRFAIFQGAVRKRVLRRRRLALELLAVRPGMSVLDIGCAHGPYARSVLEAGGEWVGVDVALRILQFRARPVGSVSQPTPPCVNAKASDLPFARGSFGGVLCVGVLNYHSLAEVCPIFDEIARVLRPGGVAVVSSLRLDPVTWVRSRLYPGLPVPISVPGPVYPHRTSTISELLDEVGLSIADVQDVKKYGVQPHYALLKLLRLPDSAS